MRSLQSNDEIILVSLWMGVLVPIIYFAMQIIAAAFYPGYNFLSQTASELGSPQFVYASLFNGGIFILGIITLAAAFGYLRALLRLGTNPILAGLISLEVVASGVSSLWAAGFPLPDPRHGAQPPFLNIVILMPVLLAAALWKQPNARLLKAYLITSTLLVVAMVPIVSGVIGIDRQSYNGLIQRIFAVAVFPPIGVGAYFLAMRIKDLSRKIPIRKEGIA